MTGPRRSVAAAVAVSTVCVLPVFLTGALAVQIRRDLQFSEAALGLAAAVFFTAGVITSAVGGRLVERIGATAGLRLAVLTSVVTMMGIALAADSWGTVLAFLAVGGTANAIAQPGANLLLARTVQPQRRGLAFGIKQSAIPASMLVGGLAVPAVALTIGWRWAFGIGAALGLAITATIPPGARVERTPRETPRPAARSLALLALAAGLGAAAANTLGTFLVTSTVEQGISEAPAGLLFALGSGVGLSTRLWVGAAADRRGRPEDFRRVGLMLVIGSVGYALLGTASSSVLVPATLLAFAFGWGWPGLFNFSVVNRYVETPGAATGITQSGVYLGALSGPLVFGALAEQFSFEWAWVFSAALSLAAGLAVAGAASRRARTEPSPVDPSPEPHGQYR